jgi:uncharacterized membrane protein
MPAARPARRMGTMAADESGVVSIMAAIVMTTMIGFAAITIDVGSWYATQRSLQKAADVAALAAAYDLSIDTLSPANAATLTLAANGFSSPIVTCGQYAANSSIPPASRITGLGACPALGNGNGTGPNLAKVVASTTAPVYFGGVLGQTGPVAISVQAAATRVDQAGFEAGTGLLSLNGGVLNALLPGTSINLSLVDYNGLAQTNITALDFMNALATELGVSAGSYGSLLQSSVTMQQLIQAQINALNGEGNVTGTRLAALNGLLGLQSSITGTPTVALGNLFDLGIWQNEAIGGTNPPAALSAGLNLYQLVSLAAQVSNGAHFLTIPSATIGVPGLASVTAASTVIEPLQQPAFAFGPVGISVHTAQVRLQLQVTVLDTSQLLSGLGALASASVSIPLYVEVASGNATLQSIACTTGDSSNATVVIAAQPAAVTAYLGNISQAVMTNFSNPVTPPAAAPVASISLLGGLVGVAVKGSATANVGSPSPTDLTFSVPQTQTSPPSLPPTQTTSSTNMLTELSSSLTSSLQLSASVTGILPLGLQLGTITSLVGGAITPVFGVVDQLVDPLLAALGIRIGYMDVTATGVRCGVPVLVD